jgi:hypothetical protein
MAMNRAAVRRRLAIALAAALAASVALASPAYAATATYLNEPFSGTSVAAGTWTSGGGSASSTSTTLCLTASDAGAGAVPMCAGGPLDAPGAGTLRLTSEVAQAAFAISNTPIPTNRGLHIEYDLFQYSSDFQAADGSAFVLVDGAASPTQAGYLGLGLGYESAFSVTEPGLVGGYAGIGFDWWGNFSDPIGGTGGPGPQPNSIVVRGSEASGYEYLTAAPATGQLAVMSTAVRDPALRHVVIDLSSLGILSVSVDYGTGLVQELSNVDLTTVSGALPPTLKLGFTAGTGGLAIITDFRNLVVQSLEPELAATGSDLSALPFAAVAILTGLLMLRRRRLA